MSRKIHLLIAVGLFIIIGVGVYLVVSNQDTSSKEIPNPTSSFPPAPFSLEVIQLKNPSETLGFGDYQKNPSNVPFVFINARVLSSPDSDEKQFYRLCGTNEETAMSIFSQYLAYENRDFILDDPKSSPEQKQQRMSDGYGTWHLVDYWKADTHYHYVTAPAGEPHWKHVILEDCNYFTPITESRPRTIGGDYSESIGTFEYTSKTPGNFLDFLLYSYGQGQDYFAENKIHSIKVDEDDESVTIIFNVAIVHSGDWGMPPEYTYHTITHTLNKNTGNVSVNSKATGNSTTAKIDMKFLR